MRSVAIFLFREIWTRPASLDAERGTLSGSGFELADRSRPASRSREIDDELRIAEPLPIDPVRGGEIRQQSPDPAVAPNRQSLAVILREQPRIGVAGP